MGRLVRDDRKTTITQITTRYNQDLQNTISEHNTSNPEADGLQQQKTTPVPLLSDKNSTRRIQFTYNCAEGAICTLLSSTHFTHNYFNNTVQHLIPYWVINTS